MIKSFINKHNIHSGKFSSSLIYSDNFKNSKEIALKTTTQEAQFRISKLFILNILHNHIVDYPTPKNFNYFYNFGVIAGIILVLQILTGVLLTMHYTPNTALAFLSLEHIMRDVNMGWFLRYAHANGASMFFFIVYLHIARGIFYSSYKTSVGLWISGVIIFILMMAAAFIGYVLPWGQMSFWGEWNCPTYFLTVILWRKRLPGNVRIGPHNIDILSIFVGALLGDAHGERHWNGLGTRVSFTQENTHGAYLLWLHKLVASLGYCNPKAPTLSSRLGRFGKLRKVIRFHTYTFSSLNWLHSAFYVNHRKILPIKLIEQLLTPLALAIWIMDDGTKSSAGLRLCTNCFTKPELCLLCDFLHKKYDLVVTINSAGDIKKQQFCLYINKISMPKLAKLVKPFIHDSMKYKLNGYLK